jgi:hypothetical protein
MSKKTLQIANATVEISIKKNLIHISILGEYTDEVLLKLTQYVDGIIDQIPGNPIQVWDTSGVPAQYLKLTRQGIDETAELVKRIKRKKPDSVIYFLSPTVVNFGMARKLDIESGLKEIGIVVIKSINDLPLAIKSKLPK